jgi:hypothetical protein
MLVRGRKWSFYFYDEVEWLNVGEKKAQWELLMRNSLKVITKARWMWEDVAQRFFSANHFLIYMEWLSSKAKEASKVAAMVTLVAMIKKNFNELSGRGSCHSLTGILSSADGTSGSSAAFRNSTSWYGIWLNKSLLLKTQTTSQLQTFHKHSKAQPILIQKPPSAAIHAGFIHSVWLLPKSQLQKRNANELDLNSELYAHTAWSQTALLITLCKLR